MHVRPTLSAAAYVPSVDRITPVSNVSRVTIDTPTPISQAHRAGSGPHAHAETRRAAPQGRYTANAAAPGFAAHILVEAGLTGTDPMQHGRALRAYSNAQPLPSRPRLRI
ncbi:MAG: hypothetical protein RL186_1882 [Pseudomonadota bacterium]|jgi:hypothetical protein